MRRWRGLPPHVRLPRAGAADGRARAGHRDRGVGALHPLRGHAAGAGGAHRVPRRDRRGGTARRRARARAARRRRGRAGAGLRGASATGGAPGTCSRIRVFWKQQVYLLQRLVVGFALAIAELALLALGAGGVAQPIDYRWMDTSLGSWRIDSFGRALAYLPAGLAALVVCALLVRPFGALARTLIVVLLGGGASADADAVRTYSGDAPASPRRPRGRPRRRRGAHDADLGASRRVGTSGRSGPCSRSASRSSCTPGSCSSTWCRRSRAGSG